MLKPLLGFTVLLLVLVSWDVWLTSSEATERRERVRVGRLVSKEEREGRPVAALRLESAAMPVQLYVTQGGGVWRCVSYHNAIASADKVESVVKKLFEAEGVIQSEDPQRARDYGLAMPTTLHVSLHGANLMKDRNRDVISDLEIGNPTHDQEGCFIRRAGSHSVWSVDTNPRPELDLAPGQKLPPLLDPSIVPNVWWKSAKQMKGLRVEVAGAVYDLEMRERQLTPEEMKEMRAPPDPTKPQKPRFEWYLKRGGGEQLIEYRVSGAYTSFLARAPYRDVLDPAKRAQAKLDVPRAKLTITSAEGKPLTLLLGGDEQHPVVENDAVQSLYEIEPAVAPLLFPSVELLTKQQPTNPWEPWLKRQ